MVFKSQIPDSIPSGQYKDLVSNFFWHQLDRFQERTLFVNLETGREWTGKQIKQASGQLAQQLITKVGLRPNEDCVWFYKNNDFIQISALAVLFAGGSVCVGEPEDPEREQEYMLASMRPKVVFICHKLLERMRELRQKLSLTFKLIIMDDDDDDDDEVAGGGQIGQQRCMVRNEKEEFLLHKQLLSKPVASLSDTIELPVQVSPERPAFVLFTSGSTGDPKAVSRTQRNCLYVCFSLPQASTAHLWPLSETSVLAGHLQLDHGTGTFCLKMTLSKGSKLILMKRFKCSKMLAAIEKYQITDCIMGSALLHNFVSAHLERAHEHDLSSLRNLIATGSPIVSRPLLQQFSQLYPSCSARQAFGMTEMGFISIVERDRASKCQSVGPLMPNVTVKLLDNETGQEIDRVNQEGELYVAGPTLTSGYLGERFQAQTKQVFLEDGFYRSSDIAIMQTAVPDELTPPPNHHPTQRLVIRGRYKEVLLLYDGWKVLPSELEQLLQEHPLVLEAAVVGVAHPELPSCHAPRAYVVLKQQRNGLPTASNGNDKINHHCRSTKSDQELAKELFDFAASRTSEPKHFIGGLKIVQELPRLSIGKVDKKLLKQQDGLA